MASWNASIHLKSNEKKKTHTRKNNYIFFNCKINKWKAVYQYWDYTESCVQDTGSLGHVNRRSGDKERAPERAVLQSIEVLNKNYKSRGSFLWFMSYDIVECSICAYTHIHSLLKAIYRLACFWTVKGKRRIWRKPTSSQKPNYK